MGKRGSVTQGEIAIRAKKSITTVSRALSRNATVAEKVDKKTRAEIFAIAEELGYSQKYPGSAEVQMRTVGVLVPSVRDPFWTSVIEGILELAAQLNWNVVVTFSNNSPELELKLIQNLHYQNVAGVIIAASREEWTHLKALEEIHIPVAMINFQANMKDLPERFVKVDVDDRLAAKNGVSELIKLGHKKIGYLGLMIRPRSNYRRFLGYKDAMENEGLPIDDNLIIMDDQVSSDMEIAIEFGKKNAPILYERGITALFCYNDLVAVGALQGLSARDIAIPEQCSILGFDGIEAAGYVSPTITTIRQPRPELGQVAFLRLVQKIEGDKEETSLMKDAIHERYRAATVLGYNHENNSFLPRISWAGSTAKIKS